MQLKLRLKKMEKRLQGPAEIAPGLNLRRDTETGRVTCAFINKICIEREKDQTEEEFIELVEVIARQ